MQQLVVNSLLYLELKAEHEEILKHKWIESQKIGKDIGFDVAKINWRLKHHSNWRKWWRQQQCQAFGI
jgi:predicted transcriptional regulator